MQASALAMSEEWTVAVRETARSRQPRRTAASADTDVLAMTTLAHKAGYRIETARAAGRWLLIDADGELVRTPTGDKSWTVADALLRLAAVAPRGV